MAKATIFETQYPARGLWRKAVTMSPPSSGKLALALSGGGVRAVAHLGVVEVLRREGWEIEVFSGSSGGALAAVLLCDGYAPREILEIFRTLGRGDLFRRSAKGGLLSLRAVQELLETRLRRELIEDFPTECVIATTDMYEGRVHYFDKGPAAKLAVASSSLVPFFPPLPYGGLQLADGGFMDNMPAKPLFERDLTVVGVNVNAVLPRYSRNVFQTTYRTLILMMAANVEASKRYCDLYLEVPGCADINIFDTYRLDAAYDAGIEAAEASLETLRTLTGRK